MNALRTPSPSKARGDKILLGARVADEIRGMIRSDGLEDGAVLPSETTLADKFQVSQRVVRDALRVLSQQGIVRTQQGKPAMVIGRRPLAIQNYFKLALEDGLGSFDELIELRQALEVRATGRAAAAASAEEIEALRAMLTASEEATILERRVDADLALHSAIITLGRNRFFAAIFDSVATFLAEERRRGQEMTEGTGGDHARSHREHREIVDAIENGDPERAERAMRSHLDRVQREFERNSRSTSAGA